MTNKPALSLRKFPFNPPLKRGSIDAMTTEGWIFMVGFRVFDVGLLVVWLIWFFRLRDDDDDSRGDDGGGGEGPGPRRVATGPAAAASSCRSAPGTSVAAESATIRAGQVWSAAATTSRFVPAPARVRRPSSPVPTHRN